MTSIAVFGTSGALGKPVLDALTSTLVAKKIAYPIKAITTKDKSGDSTDKIEYIQGDIVTGGDKLAAALKGVDVIISLVTPDVKLFKGLEGIVKAVKPQLYIPSEYGIDYLVDSKEIGFQGTDDKREHAAAIESAGIKTSRIFTSTFRIPPVFLYAFTNHVGINQETKTVTYSDNQEVIFSTGEDIGKVISLVANTDPSQVKDSYRVYSSSTTVQDIVKQLEKEQGVTYKIEHKTAKEIVSEVPEGDFIAYLFAVFALGKGHGILLDKDDRELINPGQSLFKWSTW